MANGTEPAYFHAKGWSLAAGRHFNEDETYNGKPVCIIGQTGRDRLYAPDDFALLDMRQVANSMTEATRTMTLFLGAIAAVSLVVGGIGIMNIMLVSVTERTREIGVRLTIGALPSQIRMQFLCEAVLLTLAGVRGG